MHTSYERSTKGSSEELKSSALVLPDWTGTVLECVCGVSMPQWILTVNLCDYNDSSLQFCDDISFSCGHRLAETFAYRLDTLCSGHTSVLIFALIKCLNCFYWYLVVPAVGAMSRRASGFLPI